MLGRNAWIYTIILVSKNIKENFPSYLFHTRRISGAGSSRGCPHIWDISVYVISWLLLNIVASGITFSEGDTYRSIKRKTGLEWRNKTLTKYTESWLEGCVHYLLHTVGLHIKIQNMKIESKWTSHGEIKLHIMIQPWSNCKHEKKNNRMLSVQCSVYWKILLLEQCVTHYLQSTNLYSCIVVLFFFYRLFIWPPMCWCETTTNMKQTLIQNYREFYDMKMHKKTDLENKKKKRCFQI